MCYAIGEERRVKRNIRVQAGSEQKQEKLYNREMQNPVAQIQAKDRIQWGNGDAIIEEIKKEIAIQEQDRFIQKEKLEELEKSLKQSERGLDEKSKEELQKQVQIVMSIEQLLRALNDAKDAFVLAGQDTTQLHVFLAFGNYQKSVAIQLRNLYKERSDIASRSAQIKSELQNLWWFMPQCWSLKNEQSMLNQRDSQLDERINTLEEKNFMLEGTILKLRGGNEELGLSSHSKETEELEEMRQGEEQMSVPLETEIQTLMQEESEADRKTEKILEVWGDFLNKSMLSYEGLKEAGKMVMERLIFVLKESGQDIDSQIKEGSKKINHVYRCIIENDNLIGKMACKVAKKYFLEKILDPLTKGGEGVRSKIEAIKERKKKHFGKIQCFESQVALKKAGKVIMDELVSRRVQEKQKLDEALKRYQKSDIKRKIDEAESIKNQLSAEARFYDKNEKIKMMWEVSKIEFWELYLGEQAKNMRDEMRQAKEAYQKSSIENANELKTLLSHVRKMGASNKKDRFVPETGNSWEKEIQALNEAINYYPTDWVEESDKSTIVVTGQERGFYHAATNRIALSGSTEDQRLETGIHELGHRFEEKNGDILEEERIFLEERSEEYGGREINISTNPWKKEMVIDGGFLDPYIGKKYADVQGYEIVSMGFQYAYTNPTFLWQDEDYAQLIYGILALC